MGKTRYYILFDNYEDGLALHGMLDEADVPNHISPTPRAIKGSTPCGMSLMLRSEDVDAARAVIEAKGAAYLDIVPMDGQLESHRDRYC